jgi:hypothetical protein
MLPLFVSGVFVAGLVWLRKLGEPEPWKNRKEEESFRRERERWVNDAVTWTIRP